MMTQRTISVTIPANGTYYLDFGLLYSASNHRFVRQGGVFNAKFHIDGDVAAALGADEQFIITTLPTTWPLQAAYKQARKIYDLAMSPEKGLTSKPSRWHDFKVFMDTAHKTQDSGPLPKIVPDGCSIDFSASGNADYVYSQTKDDAGTNTYTWHVLGVSDLAGTDRSFGVVSEYDRQNDTSTDEGSANYSNYDEILNDVNQANDQFMQEDGDKPPYNKDNINLPTVVNQLFVFGSNVSNTGHSVRSTGFIDVPLGLVKVQNNITAARTLQITFAPGKMKGIKWEAMA
jgi:hypothetical protein